MFPLMQTEIARGFTAPVPYQHFPAEIFPIVQPPKPHDWLFSHFAVGGWSPLQRLSGMLTAHMTRIAPHSGFTWHPHRALEIYTWVLEGELYHEDTTGGKGVIQAGELQRMFAGDYIEHQELNRSDKPVRVIQIWFIADRQHRGLPPHYQQLSKTQLPKRRVGDATVTQLINDGSPMEHHVTARLTATTLDANGITQLEPPQPHEDLFVYITDGEGVATHGQRQDGLRQYDVMLVKPDAQPVELHATPNAPLHLMSYYLPKFLS